MPTLTAPPCSPLNGELRRADLFCSRTSADGAPDRCKYELHDWDPVGFVSPEIELSRPRRDVLVVRAGLGILCGTDMSAYAFEWRDAHWQRFWQSEQPIVDGVEYHRSTSMACAYRKQTGRPAHALVMTRLGNYTWCQSNWYPAYFRVWRGSDGDGKEAAFDAENRAAGFEPVMTGSVRLDGFNFGVLRGSIDHGNTMIRTVTRHYRVSGDAVTRIEPIAKILLHSSTNGSPGPDESRHYAAADNLGVRRVACRLARDTRTPTSRMRAARGQELWQVGLKLELDDKPLGTRYFIVAWHPRRSTSSSQWS
jgi:hypothetical protein